MCITISTETLSEERRGEGRGVRQESEPEGSYFTWMLNAKHFFGKRLTLILKSFSAALCKKHLPWHLIIAKHTREKKALFTAPHAWGSMPLCRLGHVITADWRSTLKLCTKPAPDCFEGLMGRMQAEWRKSRPIENSRPYISVGWRGASIGFETRDGEGGSSSKCQIR